MQNPWIGRTGWLRWKTRAEEDDDSQNDTGRFSARFLLDSFYFRNDVFPDRFDDRCLA